jgi:hypothetical protein
MANTMPMANSFPYQPRVTAGYGVPGIASSPYTTPFAAPYAPLPPFYQPSMQLPLPQANAQGGYGPAGYTPPYAAAQGYVQPYAPPLAQGGYGVNGGYAQAPIRNGFAPPYFPPRAAVPLPVPIFRAPFHAPFQAPLAVPRAFAGQQGARAYAVAPPVVPVPPAVARSRSINQRQLAFVSTRNPANILLPPTQRLARKLPLNRVKTVPLVEPVLSPSQILKTNAGSNPALAATPVAKTPVPVTPPPLPSVVNLKTKWKNLGDAVKDIAKEVKTTLGLPEKTVPMAVPDLPPVYKPWNRQLVPTSGSFFLPETAGKSDEPLAREIRTYLKKKPPAKDPDEIIEEDASIVDPKER